MTTNPPSAAETDAAIRATCRRLARQLETAAREAWKAAGEGIPGYTCRCHGWEECEDITCQQIAAAVASERQRWQAALTDALDGLEDMFAYVPEFFREKWDHQGYIDRARAAVAGTAEAETRTT